MRAEKSNFPERAEFITLIGHVSIDVSVDHESDGEIWHLVDVPIGGGNLVRRGLEGWELVSRYGIMGDGWIFKRPLTTKTPEEHARAALGIPEILARRAYLDALKPEERAKVKSWRRSCIQQRRHPRPRPWC